MSQAEEHKSSAMARADALTGVVLLALGLAMLVGGYTMDRLEIRQIHPLSIPGLVPMLLGAALAVCSVILLAGALKAGALAGSIRAGVPGPMVLRLLICLALTLGYPLVLIGWLDFWLATAIFVTLFTAVFEWRERSPAAHAVALAVALALGLAVGLVTAYVFQELFLVRLP